MEKTTCQFLKPLALICGVSVALFALPVSALAATLSLSPAGGTFTAGSTFDVKIFLNTENESANVVGASVSFPPDKLQLVSPSTGESIIGIWNMTPRVDNQIGRMELQGGIPGGANVSSGLIATVRFRARGVGSAVIRFLDDSRVLRHDGKGTDILRSTASAIYELTLPPPAGPLVASRTHPDQSLWYANPNVVFRWTDQEGSLPDGYSYEMSDEPDAIPDNVSEGQRDTATYANVPDGIRYFHIKELRGGRWGSTTHYAVKVDTAPPAAFPIEVTPASRTTRRQPVIQFGTTDQSSGLDHYELKLVPLQKSTALAESEARLFVEAESPYIPAPLELGSYDVIVRAYDHTGNYRETTEKLRIVTTIFRFVSDQGLEIKNAFVISWPWVWIGGVILLAAFSYGGFRLREWHRGLDSRRAQKELPPTVKKQLEDLKEYRAKYGALIVFLLLTGMAFTGGAPAAVAQESALPPPIVTAVSRNLSNEEIFYMGGKVTAPESEIVIYLQRVETGAAQSYRVPADRKGDWFYRHHTFLPSGEYLLWAQSKVAEELSPPSPQFQMTVQATALQFGASRLSYETLYLVSTILLFLMLSAAAAYAIFHGVHGRRKRALLMKEVREAEESLRRGFAVLRRDIEAELATVKKARLGKGLSTEEKEREEQLLRDLTDVERYVGKEIWDVERAETA